MSLRTLRRGAFHFSLRDLLGREVMRRAALQSGERVGGRGCFRQRCARLRAMARMLGQRRRATTAAPAAAATKALLFRRGRSDVDDMRAPELAVRITNRCNKRERGQDNNSGNCIALGVPEPALSTLSALRAKFAADAREGVTCQLSALLP